MEKTKIDWCDSTWNPVTGCLHGCKYCYARGISNRFSGGGEKWCEDKLIVLEEKVYAEESEKAEPYPYGFVPTFHKYRLDEYAAKKKRNIFVCSMADLFGKWVPTDWKIEVLEACRKAPQHNYLFLTKDPIGYFIRNTWNTEALPGFTDQDAYTDNMWLGVTYTGRERLTGHYTEQDVGNHLSIWTNFWYLWRMSDTILPTKAHKFISIEPLGCDICEITDERDGGKLLENFLLPKNRRSFFEWIIVGAETGNRKDRVIPKREWVEKLVDLCRRADIPLFMKSSLASIWGEPLIQEFPKELAKKQDFQIIG